MSSYQCQSVGSVSLVCWFGWFFPFLSVGLISVAGVSECGGIASGSEFSLRSWRTASGFAFSVVLEYCLCFFPQKMSLYL